MTDEVNIPEDLKIVARHEAAHAVMNRLLGRPIEYIELCCTNGAWAGETKPHTPQSDPDWSSLDLDRKVPPDELRFQYSKHPDSYKVVREENTISYAGIVSEELLYEQMGIKRDAKQLPENKRDICDAEKRVRENFLSEEWKQELDDAKSRARKILSNSTVREMVEDLARELINGILQSKNRLPLREVPLHLREAQSQVDPVVTKDGSVEPH
jgi:hypothetical protein